MSKIDHPVIVKVLDVILDYGSALQENRPSSYSFLYVPLFSIVLHWSGSWKRVRSIEFVCVKVSAVGIDVFCLVFAFSSDAKGAYSGMDIGASIDAIGSFNLPFFG